MYQLAVEDTILLRIAKYLVVLHSITQSMTYTADVPVVDVLCIQRASVMCSLAVYSMLVL